VRGPCDQDPRNKILRYIQGSEEAEMLVAPNAYGVYH
jgi:hypothetical protein